MVQEARDHEVLQADLDDLATMEPLASLVDLVELEFLEDLVYLAVMDFQEDQVLPEGLEFQDSLEDLEQSDSQADQDPMVRGK